MSIRKVKVGFLAVIVMNVDGVNVGSIESHVIAKFVNSKHVVFVNIYIKFQYNSMSVSKRLYAPNILNFRSNL